MTRAHKAGKMISGSEVQMPAIVGDVAKEQLIVSPAGTNTTIWRDSDSILGGSNGTNGVDGVNGTNGSNGTNGINGTNGANGDDFDGRYLTDDFRTGTAEILALTNQGGIVSMNNAAPNVLTIPPNVDVAFGVRTRIDVHQEGAGLTSIAAGAGVTLVSYSGLNSYGQYSGISLWQIAIDKWGVYGAVA